MALIQLRDVEKSYEATGKIIRPLTLEIPKGQFVSFLGPSGCGKSTLLRIVAGLEKPDRGSVACDEMDRLSFVFQDPLLLPWRTTLENVRLPLELEGKIPSQDHADAAHHALDRVGLADAHAKMPHQLSGGMKMRASLARALVTKPKLLLLDEPFSALDEVTRFRLQEELRGLWHESAMTVIFVTHSMSEAAFLADRQIVFSHRPAQIAADRVSALGSTRDAQTRLSLEFANEVKELQERFRA